MKLAIAYQNGEVYQHFGDTPSFLLLEIEDGKVLSKLVHDNGGRSHVALIGVLQSLGAEALIVGGIGSGAFGFLHQTGIKVYAGVVGSAEQAIADYLGGKLAESETATHQCSRHCSA